MMIDVFENKYLEMMLSHNFLLSTFLLFFYIFPTVMSNLSIIIDVFELFPEQHSFNVFSDNDLLFRVKVFHFIVLQLLCA